MEFLFEGPVEAPATILLAHGAAAPMDSKSMNAVAEALAAEGLRTARFEFAYMAGRRSGAGRKPPPRADRLQGEYVAAVEALGAEGRLFIGGKSMGGRVASMVADALYSERRISGLICLGYPFHPPGRPTQVRTAHLKGLATPALICQGTRDPFGTPDDVAGYALSPTITLRWIEGGDHDFKAPKASGRTAADNFRAAAAEIARWIDGR